MNSDSILRWFGVGISQSETLLRLQIRFIRILALVGVAAAALGAIVLLATNSSTVVRGIVVAFVLVNIGLLELLRRGRVQAAATILVAALVAVALFTPNAFVLIAVLALIAGAALLNNFLFLITNILIIGKQVVVVFSALAAAPEGGAMPPSLTGALVLGAALTVVSFATRIFIEQAEQEAVRAKQGANLLQTVAEIGEAVGKVLSLSEVLPRAVELIRERFSFNQAQIYLLDESRAQAALAASTAAQGQRLYERQASVETGTRNAIGLVLAEGRPMVVRERDAIARNADLMLPNTRSQLVLPIFDGDQIIGALDVQSRQADAFNREVEQAMQVLSNLLGTSIRNARLFEAQERSTREAKRLFVESEANLREIQRLNQQLTHAGWSDYLRQRQDVSGVSVDDSGVSADVPWSENLSRALETRQTVREDGAGGPVIAVPLMLAGEVIGAIEVESEAGADAENVEMVKAVAQRLAISLDKARLFEESQAATAREQRINEIVAQFQTVATVDDLLKITLAELGRTFGATEGAIRLGIAPQSAASEEGHGSAALNGANGTHSVNGGGRS